MVGEAGLAPQRLVLMGDSAGANLALLAAIDQRDAPGAIPVAALGLIYPVTGPVAPSGSARDFAEGYFLTRHDDGLVRRPLCAAAGRLAPRAAAARGARPAADGGA